ICNRSGLGKDDGYFGTAPHGARRTHRSTVRLHEMLHDGKAEACPSDLARASRIHPIESLEDARQVLARNSNARIAHAQDDARLLAAREDGNAPRLRIPNGVLHEVLQNLTERCGVSQY